MLFYRGPCVRITHRAFEAWEPVEHSVAIRDLDDVWVVHREVEPPVAAMSRRVCSTGLVGGALAVTADGLRLAEVPTPFAVALVAVVALGSVVPLIRRWIRHRPQALVALSRGRRVLLFETTDPVVFGQVRRALSRAIEWRDDRV